MMMIQTLKNRLKASQVQSAETVSEPSEQYVPVFRLQGASAST